MPAVGEGVAGDESGWWLVGNVKRKIFFYEIENQYLCGSFFLFSAPLGMGLLWYCGNGCRRLTEGN